MTFSEIITLIVMLSTYIILIFLVYWLYKSIKDVEKSINDIILSESKNDVILTELEHRLEILERSTDVSDYTGDDGLLSYQVYEKKRVLDSMKEEMENSFIESED